MDWLISVFGWMLLALALAGAIYTLLAGVFVQRFFAGKAPAPTDAFSGSEGVAVLKPLHRVEPGLRGRLESFFLQTDPSPVQIVFGSDHPDDPALGIVRTLASAYPERKVLIGANPKIHGQNRKVSNIINMIGQERVDGDDRPPIIVLSDSDIAVQPDYLLRVKQALAEPGVGVVSCPYFGVAQAGFWSEMVAMGLSYQFLPGVIAGAALGAARPCMGSTIALRRDTLERIGGFEAFRDMLADDYAIGAAVRKLGLQSRVAPILVSHACAEATFKEAIAHEVRWARTVKGVDPIGYLGSVITYPLPLSMLASVLLGFAPCALMVVAAATGARIWMMSRVDKAVGRRFSAWWLMAMRDTISFLVFVASFFVRSVEWRGLKFHVTANGNLRPLVR